MADYCVKAEMKAKEMERIFDDMEDTLKEIVKEAVDLDDLLSMDKEDYGKLAKLWDFYKKVKNMAIDEVKIQEQRAITLQASVDNVLIGNKKIIELLMEQKNEKKEKKEDKKEA